MSTKAIEALRRIKSFVCGDAVPNWRGEDKVFMSRVHIANECDAAIAELEAEQAQAKPAGEATLMPGTQGFTMAVFAAADVPPGTKLYTSPQLQDSAEPLFLLHSGLIDDGGEQGEWEYETPSYQRVEDFCRRRPGKIVGLYPKVKS